MVEDNSYDEMDEDSNEDNSYAWMSFTCSWCYQKNPASNNYCNHCGYRKQTQSPATFTIHSPQLSPRNHRGNWCNNLPSSHILSIICLPTITIS
jgi:cellulase/cellobiase CelA1